MNSSVEQVKHELQLEERLDLHKRGWLIQRIGWATIFLIMLSGALGLTGDGVLSNRTIKQGNVEVEYQRFYRYESDMGITIKVTDAQGPSTISLPEEYLRKFRVVRIVPEPQQYYIKAGYVSYIFNAHAGFQASFYVRPQQPGIIRGIMTVNNTSIPLHHIIYP